MDAAEKLENIAEAVESLEARMTVGEDYTTPALARIEAQLSQIQAQLAQVLQQLGPVLDRQNDQERQAGQLAARVTRLESRRDQQRPYGG